MQSSKRQRKGQCFIELAVGALFLIPLALMSLDIVTLVLANLTNDTAAKNAAREAANQPDATAAKEAAIKAINGIKKSTIITSITLEEFDYPNSKDSVTVKTKVDVKLPVPFPGHSHEVFTAKSVQPIVSE